MTWTGADALKAKLAELEGKVTQTVGAALYEVGNRVMTDSKENYVPVATGTLRRSGFVGLPEVAGPKVSVSVGYNTPYALRTHENPRAGKTGGRSPQGQPYKRYARRGEWKFLETPLKAHSPEMAAELRKGIDALAEE